MLFFFLPFGLYAILRYKALGSYFFGAATTTIVENHLIFSSFLERIFTAFKVLFMYVERLVWPIHLSADYSFNTIQTVSNPFVSLESAVGILILILLVVLIVFYKKVNKEISFGAVLFLFPYLIISNLIKPVGTIMGERLMYFPSLGFVVLLAWLLERLLKVDRRKISYFILLVILVFFSARTIIRNKDWRDAETLFTATVQE